MLHSYGAAMDACASAGQLERALEVAGWMEEGGHPLNRVAYTTLIKVGLFLCFVVVCVCGHVCCARARAYDQTDRERTRAAGLSLIHTHH